MFRPRPHRQHSKGPKSLIHQTSDRKHGAIIKSALIDCSDYADEWRPRKDGRLWPTGIWHFFDMLSARSHSIVCHTQRTHVRRISVPPPSTNAREWVWCVFNSPIRRRYRSLATAVIASVIWAHVDLSPCYIDSITSNAWPLQAILHWCATVAAHWCFVCVWRVCYACGIAPFLFACSASIYKDIGVCILASISVSLFVASTSAPVVFCVPFVRISLAIYFKANQTKKQSKCSDQE